MTLVEELHAAHKARLSRMGAPPYQAPVIAVPRPPIQPQAFDAGWDGMWFYDVIFGHSKEPRRVRVRDVQEAVCKFYDVSILDMLSARRALDISFPRQIAFYLCRILTQHGFAEIGRRFGGRDHTTVIHGSQKIGRLYGDDLKVTCDINSIRKVLA